ncbi:class I mannose-6-phosphate isomerase [Oceanobacillus sojae]|uniref:class I mannose-6-phosphate isomerase n=1 Tax=Oceanobacillus sojae TaxID=582851 RepID=UPI0021A6AA25|nr:class I mannose-6-phosphate isomerase [Oceanobacillus sojae]MCT1901922.1 class I mannose-6-phosphate isomerase [Oceanobacillus sojae]
MYRLRPALNVKEKIKIYSGFEEVINELSYYHSNNHNRSVAIEVHPSLPIHVFAEQVKKAFPQSLITMTDSLYQSPEFIHSKLYPFLTDDEVFGRFSPYNFVDFLCSEKITSYYKKIAKHDNLHFLIGVGASKIIDYDSLVYIDTTRWEIQNIYKNGLSNWQGFKDSHFNEKLKRAYYFEWPASTDLKNDILFDLDFYIDLSDRDDPSMVSGNDFKYVMKQFTIQPFRLVPFFEQGVWGGKWLQEKFNVEKDKINLAWCFDGVPEENSVLITCNEKEIEIPAQNLVLLYPNEILGEKVFGRYGKDFPIRFNFLDTIEGQNLSLQVHPTLDYAYRRFGAKYTQDESYYVVEAKDGAKVYLGLKDGVKVSEFVTACEEAQQTGEFNDEKFVHSLAVKKHDHLLIPGGTIHSSGKGNVVLEISSTPNRFTFKLWDWGRVDLDGKPRPISIHHGKHVINDTFKESYVNKEFYNNINVLKEEEGHKEEITGLHELESIGTKRLTFTKAIKQSTENSVNMLNLVEGKQIQVKIDHSEVEIFDVYYGETFIIPEKVKDYTLIPVANEQEVKVMKAYIR